MMSAGGHLQFVILEGHNILEVTERLFASGVGHSSLRPKATTYNI